VSGDVGTTAWISCAGQLPWGQSSDQRPDEVRSLTYTWDPLDDELEILGHPVLRARVTADAPVAYLSAKVCDVFPDGSSSLVVRGLLNLTHRDSPDAPSPLTPGVAYDVELPLEVCSWTFEAGHRIRLDLAGTDWPNAWAPPQPVTLTIDRAATSLELPALDGPSPIADVPVLPPPNPRAASISRKERDKPVGSDTDFVRWRIEEDVLGRRRRCVAESAGDYRAAGDVPSFAERYGGSVSVSLDDPGGADAEATTRFELRFPEATCAVESRLRVESDRDTYRVRIDLAASEGGTERWRRAWDRTIPRDLQ
jgi:hypothetical protein